MCMYYVKSICNWMLSTNYIRKKIVCKRGVNNLTYRKKFIFNVTYEIIYK